MAPLVEVLVMVSLQEDLVIFFLVVPRKKDLLFVVEMLQPLPLLLADIAFIRPDYDLFIFPDI